MSVNVGRPRTVAWRGRDVTSAIWKKPVEGRRRVGRLNVDGDEQADRVGHGGEHRAVFVYQLSSYRYWERELGRTLDELGGFGENFTVDGADDEDVCVGDRLAIGSALFEVTQPRVTCFKVGIRLDEPRMPALLTGHGRPGFYLRVLEEGEVGAGDAIVTVADGPERVSVRRVSDLLYTDRRDTETLRRVLSIDALADGWKDSFAALLDQLERGAGGNTGLTGPSPPVAWPGFRPFAVSQVVSETATVRSLWFQPLDGEPLPDHQPGQFAAIRLRQRDGRQLVRSYSLSAPADAKGLRISVKRDGAGSTNLHDHVSPGDRVELGAPRGAFVLETGTLSPVALISAGIGVTPLLAMLAGLANAGSQRRVAWLHVARSRAEHAFAAEASALLDRLPQAQSIVRYTRPGPDDRPGEHFDRAGRPTPADLIALGIGPGSHAYVCGPAAFMAAAQRDLLAAGLDATDVHTEAFGAASAAGGTKPHPPDDAPANGPLVTFARSGVAVRYDDRWASLLELAEACDVPVGWSCRTGVCHRCESGVVSGTVAYDPEPLDPPPDGTALICCARPDDDLVLDL